MHIAISIPLYDADQTTEQRKRKMLEAADDFLAEISNGIINNQDALDNMFALVQSVANYLLQETKDTILQGEAAEDYVATKFHFANKRHELKQENIAEQRGWAVVQGASYSNTEA